MSVSPEAYNLAVRVEARADLYFFTRYVFRSMRGYKWRQNWHHRALCDALMRVYRGETRRLIITIPPRYSKTEIAVVNFMAWALGNCPDAEFIHASYSATLAVNNAANAKRVVESEYYRAIFPEVAIRSDSKAKGEWRTTAGGSVYAQGEGGTITGFGAGKQRTGFGGAIIVDDIHKPNEATSDIIRSRVLAWYKNTLESRLNDPKQTPIIVIGQRLHEEDLPGWLLAGGTGETWEHLNLAAIQADGTALWPEMHAIEDLRRMEASKPYEFAGQYMQSPSPLGGGIFKLAWWRYFRPEAMPKPRRIIQSWDTAFKAKQTNDFSCCTTWADCDDGYYLIDVWKERVEFPELKRMVTSLAAKHSPNGILVEDKASGQSLIQELQRDTKLPIVPVPVDTDKIARAFAITPLIESGRVKLPEGAPWVADFTASLGSFPSAAHDDDVDSVTQGLAYLSREEVESKGFLDLVREQNAMREAAVAADVEQRRRLASINCPYAPGSMEYERFMADAGA